MDWIRQDGLLHITVSAILLIVLSVFLPVWVSAILALGIGAGKELWDKNHQGHCSSWHDFICDCIGVAGGTVIMILILCIG